MTFDDFIRAHAKEPLSREEERKLIELYKRTGSQNAKDLVIKSNLRFVAKCTYKMRGYGLPLEDLYQEGALGMCKALEKFDPTRGVKFCSYAVWWIRAYMNNYVFKMLLQVGRLKTQKQRKAFFKDTSALIAMKELSLNRPTFDGSQEDFIDMLDAGVDIETDYAEGEEADDALATVLSLPLNEKESYVLHQRLLSDDPQTLGEMGDRFGLSRERMRQVEGTVLRKAREELAA